MFGKLEAVIKEYNTQYGPEGGKAFLQRFEARVDGKSQEWDDKPGEGPPGPGNMYTSDAKGSCSATASW